METRPSPATPWYSRRESRSPSSWSSSRTSPDELRELLAAGIQAVFIRPAASRARNLPVEDRVRIVWADDDPVELPRRGVESIPEPFDW